MVIRKILHTLALISIIIGSTFTPALADEPGVLKSIHRKGVFRFRSDSHFDRVTAPQAPTATHTVCASGCDFSSIQAAIDAASDGDIIDLAAETYTETITIDKSIDLVGEGAENTIVQAAGEPGIATSRVVTVTGTVSVTVQGFTIQFGVTENGGGIFNQGTITLDNVTLTDNIADYGGGLFNLDGEVILNAVTITNNLALYSGGGISNHGLNENTTISIANSMFSENIGSDHGGGLYNYGEGASASVVITATEFISNSVSFDGAGGGIYSTSTFTGTANLQIDNSSFENNQAANGGAISIGSDYVSPSVDTGSLHLEIGYTTFVNNSAEVSGGAIAASTYGETPILATASISNSTFSNNFSDQLGGAIFISGETTMLVDSSTFVENTAQTVGGAIMNAASAYDSVTTTLTISNSTFSHNSAITHSGGAVFADSSGDSASFVRIINSTFAENIAGQPGAGVANYGEPGATATLILTNTILANDSPEGDCYNENGTIIDGGYNLVEDGSCGFPVGGDPLLAPLADNGGDTLTHALLPGSPAIDVIPAGECLVSTDQRGVPRPQGFGCDMGAYEGAPISIAKSVDDRTPLPGQTITFTIRVSNTTTETLTGGLISDTLPAGLNFLGPITLVPPLSGTVGSAPPILVSDLTVPPGKQITVTLPVSVSYGLSASTVITNTAMLTASELADPLTGEVMFTVANASPEIDAGSNQMVAEGELVQFQGSASDLGHFPSAIADLHWDFGDGATAAGTLTPAHTYLDNVSPTTGSAYTVTLTVTDTHGASASDWLLVTVENVAPTLSLLPDKAVYLGETITVTGTITDPGLLDTQTVTLTWADGFTETLELEASEREFTVTHVYAQPGEYPVTVQVIDKDGGWDQQDFSVSVEIRQTHIYLPLVKR